MNVRRALPKNHFDQTLYRKANTCVFAINSQIKTSIGPGTRVILFVLSSSGSYVPTSKLSMANLVCYRKYCSCIKTCCQIYMLMFMSKVKFARVNCKLCLSDLTNLPAVGVKTLTEYLMVC